MTARDEDRERELLRRSQERAAALRRKRLARSDSTTDSEPFKQADLPTRSFLVGRPVGGWHRPLRILDRELEERARKRREDARRLEEARARWDSEKGQIRVEQAKELLDKGELRWPELREDQWRGGELYVSLVDFPGEKSDLEEFLKEEEIQFDDSPEQTELVFDWLHATSSRRTWHPEEILDQIRDWFETFDEPPSATSWERFDWSPSVRHIVDTFGSWNKTLAAANLEVREPRGGSRRKQNDDRKDHHERQET